MRPFKLGYKALILVLMAMHADLIGYMLLLVMVVLINKSYF
jgi:hypothetical protein